MHKYILVFSIVVWNWGVVTANGVSYGVRGGIISQSFGEEEWGSELWKALGGLIEYKILGSSFAMTADIGAGLYQREEVIKTTKTDFQLEIGTKYLWKIVSSQSGVYGGEAPALTSISNGVAGGVHFYNVEEKSADSLNKKKEIGMGIRLFVGCEQSISEYILFGEVGWGKIFRGDIFHQKYGWTQITFMVGARF